jgi:hypothetical protein
MNGRTRRAPVTIGPLQHSSSHGSHRVQADVDGVPVWFESRDFVPRPASEAFASAFLIPALHQGVPLESAGGLDTVWSLNVQQLLPILRGWWGYRRLSPGGNIDFHPLADGFPNGEPDTTALFFSGGVDSFYTLLAAGTSPDTLVSVIGLDVPLADAQRARQVEGTLRDVAAARGVRALLVRTNVREHPLMNAISWERSHGGAMIAVGHLLEERTEVLISSSISLRRDRDWGSHWKTDPLFSSSRVRFREIGMDRRRVEKVPAIAADPLVQRHLRVCWQNIADQLNCSRCQKCLVTRLALLECGVLDRCATFADGTTLVRDLDALPKVTGRINALDQLAQSTRLPPDVLRAARALLRRSRHAQHPVVRARRAVLRTLMAWSGGGR